MGNKFFNFSHHLIRKGIERNEDHLHQSRGGTIKDMNELSNSHQSLNKDSSIVHYYGQPPRDEKIFILHHCHCVVLVCLIEVEKRRGTEEKNVRKRERKSISSSSFLFFSSFFSISSHHHFLPTKEGRRTPTHKSILQ